VRATRDVERSGNQSGIAAHQRDAGRMHRDIGATSHCDANIGGDERGRIVDAIAHHRHDPLWWTASKRSDQLCLLLGQHARVDLIESEFAAHRLRGARIVAADQHGSKSLRPKRRDGLRGAGTEHVPKREQPKRLAPPGVCAVRERNIGDGAARCRMR